MKKEEMKVKENVPRILFEIFLHGEEKDKEKIGRTIKLFETQLNKARSNKNKCRILWYIDKGEKSVDEKIQWFYENTDCKYFMILDGIKKIDKNFVKENLQKIKTFENSFNSLKSSNIEIFGNKRNKNGIQDAEVIE